MAFRLYITPNEDRLFPDGVTRRCPKYFIGTRYFAYDYGFQPMWLACGDLTPEQDAAIIANSDVFAFPLNLVVALTGQTAQQARDAYTLALIPEQWINAGMTWQQVARTTAGMFRYMQRLNSYLGNVVLIDDSTKLNVQFGSLPANVQQAILDAAASLGWQVSIAPTTQVRQFLKDLSDQWGTTPFQFLEFSI